MLCELRIENLALIRRVHWELPPGFLALTGQTGAGKTMFVGALSLLRGDKVPPKTVGPFGPDCLVEAVFDTPSTALKQLLSQLDLDDGEELLTLSRRIGADGRSRCRINGRTVPQATLKTLGERLIHLHSQHETHTLGDPATHLGYVDALGDEAHRRLIAAYQQAYRAYRQAETELEEARRTLTQAAQREDWLKSVVKELGEAALKPREEDRLWEKHRQLSEHAKLAQITAFVRLALEGNEKQKGALARVNLAAARLEEVESAQALTQSLTQAADLLERVLDGLEELSSAPCDDPVGLMEKISQRIQKVRRLKAKYGETEEEALAFLQDCRRQLATLQGGQEQLESLEKQKERTLSACLAAGVALNQSREGLAKHLKQEVDRRLAFLDMEKAAFFPQLTPLSQPQPQGTYALCFTLRTNAGQEPAPLGELASGGELSRVMLALKSALAADAAAPLLIFDEIDTGISGKTARKLGLLLQQMSRHSQVLCVTHSAQVASLADQHLLLEKSVIEGQTVSRARVITEEERIEELARILGGLQVTEAVRQNARELLQQT